MASGAPTGEDDPVIRESENWPLDRRVSSTNWRVRSNAFEFVVDQTSSSLDRDALSSALGGMDETSCLQLLAGSIGDVNANVMDKALDAFFAYVDALGSIIVFSEGGDPSGVFQSAAEACMKQLTAKCLKASKRTTLVKSVGVCGALVEVDQGMTVIDGLVEGGFSHKVPKAVATALEAVLEIVRGFYGTGEYDQRRMDAEIKVILGGIAKAKLYAHRDVTVRTHVKDIVVGLMVTSKRAEAAVRGILLEHLPETMQKEVLDGFTKYGTGADQGEKMYTKRSQKEMKARAEASNAAGAYADDVEMVDVDGEGYDATEAENNVRISVQDDVDPYEFTEPANIMPALQKAKIKVDPDEDPVAFWDCFSNKKWNVRKAALEMVNDAASKAVRLDPQQSGDYSALVREFKIILSKDANVHCAATAAMAGEALAKALRADFVGNAKLLCPDVMGRFKEKNPVMSKAAESCLQVFATYCYSLKDVSDDLASALSQKNPKLLADSLRHLAFLAERETRQNAGLCKDSLSAAVKLLSDADAKVRQEAQNAVVAFAGTMGGFASIKPYLNGVDDKKKDALEKAVKEADGTGIMGGRGGVSGASRASRASSTGVTVGAPKTAVSTSARPAPELTSAPKRPAVPKSAPITAGQQSNASNININTNLNSNVSIAMFAENTVSKEAAEEFLVRSFGPELVENLKSSLWQERVEAMSHILDGTGDVLVTGGSEASMLLLCVSHLPGWADKNFQVLNKLFEVGAKTAELSQHFGLPHASCIVQGAVEKIHELKHRAQASAALTAACERVGPKYVVSLVHQRAAWHKNPKVLAESLAWIQKTIDQFGYNNIDSKGSVVAWMKDDLSSTDPNVKSKALALLGECHSQVGPGPFHALMDSLKPALATSLQEIFAKKPIDTTYQPTLSVKSVRGVGGDGDVSPAVVGEMVDEYEHAVSDAAEAAEAEEFVANADRVDLSRSLGDSLVAQLMSSNWKERNAAVESVEELVASARHITADLPMDFLTALRKRFGDSNRNLAARSIALVGTLAKAVGPEFDRIGHATLLSGAVENLADMKKQVRDAVIGMLDAWGRTCPKERLFPVLIDAVSNPKGASEGKVLALKWMVDNYQPNVRCKELARKAAVVGAKDKAAPVRSTAAQLEKLAQGKTAADGGGGGGSDASAKLKGRVPAATLTASAASRKAATPGRAVSGRTAAARTPASKIVPKSAGISAMKRVPDSLTSAAMEDDTLLLSMGQGKGARSRQFRPKPGGFEPPSTSDHARLRELLAPVASTALCAKMFSADFQDHVDALDALTEAASGQINEILTSLDLILQWIVVILCEQNTQSSLKALDLLRLLLEHLADDGYRLSDMEASILLPAVIEKSGQNQDYLRSAYRTILVLSASVYNPAKVVDLIVLGLGTKNSRSKVECCMAISEIVEQHGGRCIMSAKNKPVVALSQLVSERDPALRSVVLAALGAIHENVDSGQFAVMLNKAKDGDRQIVENKLMAGNSKAGGRGISIDVTTEVMAAAGSAQIMDTVALDEPSQYHPGYAQHSDDARDQPYPQSHMKMHPEPMHVDQVSPIDRAEVAPPSYTLQALAKPPDNVPRMLEMSQSTPVVQPAAVTQHAGIRTPVPVELKSTPELSSDNEYAQKQTYDEREFEQRWEHNIELMYSADLVKAVDATKHVCSDIMMVTSKDGPPPSKRVLAVLASTADKFVLAVCAQLEIILADASRQVAERKDPPSSRGCKFALNALLQGLGINDLAMAIPQGTLRTAISLLLCSLVDEHGLLCFEQGPTLVRAVNVLIAKMLDAANKNYAFAALLHLLRSPPTKSLVPDAVPKFNDLVVKCLIKLTKGLDSKDISVDISFILLCLHDYFMFLGVEEIRKRSAAEDKPLRMVKTILHQICKLVGYNVYQYTTGIPGRHAQPQPIIFRYIDINLKMLKEMNQLPTDDEAGSKGSIGSIGVMKTTSTMSKEHLSPAVPSASFSHTRNLAPHLSSNDDEEVRMKLKDVLSRVTSKDASVKSVAMRELFDIKRRHPQMVEKYLHATQDRFRTYIEDSLKEMASGSGAAGISSYGSGLGIMSNSSGGVAGTPSGTNVPSVENLAERLAKLKQRM